MFLQVKCYHKSDVTLEREVIFRLQFHTGAVQGYNLVFEKEDMETANKGLHTLHTHCRHRIKKHWTSFGFGSSINKHQSCVPIDCNVLWLPGGISVIGSIIHLSVAFQCSHTHSIPLCFLCRSQISGLRESGAGVL